MVVEYNDIDNGLMKSFSRVDGCGDSSSDSIFGVDEGDRNGNGGMTIFAVVGC